MDPTIRSDDVLYMCATCGSALVEYSSLVGGDATCKVCGWHGSKDQLAVLPMANAVGMATSTFMSMTTEYRKVYAKMAKELVGFLVRWGFVTPTAKGDIPREIVLTYLNRMSQAAMKALLETRQELEQRPDE